jgi:hypothetical protein
MGQAGLLPDGAAIGLRLRAKALDLTVPESLLAQADSSE